MDNKPSEEELAAWFKANGYKKKKKKYNEKYKMEYESECDTDDEDGRYPAVVFVPAVTSELDQALWEATWNHDLAEVEALLAKGADVKALGWQGSTPLHYAAATGHTAIVDTLIAHGADVKAVDMYYGCTPLHGAAENGSAAVDTLLNAGADGTVKDKRGKSPADYALMNKQPIIVAKCDPALARAEGEKLRKAFEEATTVHVLSTRFNEPSEEVLAAWYKAKGLSLIHI